MTRKSLRPIPAALFAYAALLTAMTASAGAASIAERANPFQICIESRLEAWVNRRAEMVVNEEPEASDVDDASVAKWMVETLAACRLQANEGDQASEERFTKRVAQWRQHIYDRVQSIRELARPD